jgi:SAM-dependent methyltransferase
VPDRGSPPETPMSSHPRAPGLRPAPGQQTVPAFDRGWRRADGAREAYLSYLVDHQEVNWSTELEELHVENSREHFMDVWTRRAILERLGPVAADGAIADLGCSTGYLLEDLHRIYPSAQLIGVDMIASGLRTAHQSIPDARLLQADVCALPLEDSSVDGAVSANLLEHVPDDEGALR